MEGEIGNVMFCLCSLLYLPILRFVKGSVPSFFIFLKRILVLFLHSFFIRTVLTFN